MVNVGILCVGPANYLSICNAIKKTGNNPILIKNAKVKKKITHLILPGVGSFGAVMKEIKKKKLLNFIFEHIDSKKPLLGICAGYQILFKNSEEDLSVKGLSQFKGNLKNLNCILKIVPNIGWHETYLDKKIVKTLKLPFKTADFYYAHSYYVKTYNKDEMKGFFKINKESIPVLFMKNNIFGVQFHPEKSGLNGIKFLNSFCNLNT
jgi:glutamine amidotransferase